MTFSLQTLSRGHERIVPLYEKSTIVFEMIVAG